MAEKSARAGDSVIRRGIRLVQYLPPYRLVYVLLCNLGTSPTPKISARWAHVHNLINQSIQPLWHVTVRGDGNQK
jgi:hypothetical protein